MKYQLKVLSHSVMACSLFYVVSSHTALAACNITSTAAPVDVQMNIGEVVIPSDTAVGASFKTVDFPINTGSANLGSCTGGGRFIAIVSTAAQIGTSNIFASNVAGVGIRLSRISVAGGQTFYPQDTMVSGTVTIGSLYQSKFRVELIKTAVTTGSGAFSQGQYTTYYADGTGPSKPMLTSSINGIGITIVPPSCTVAMNSKEITVDFGSVPKSTFTGVGSTAAERNFAINLDCQQSPGNVSISIDPAPGFSSTAVPGVLTISTGTGAATGVGVQVLDTNSQPISFGTPWIPVGSRTSGAGPLSLPLKARYYQTQTTVAPGMAQSGAVFTIKYN